MTRIISGTAKNTTLTVPVEGTRPITDRAKAALFSIIVNWIPGSNILDLYAGSGSLGIEALSRGAKHATFIDFSKESINCIKSNLKKAKLSDHASIFEMKVKGYIDTQCAETFNVIFLDPPYDKVKEDQILEASSCLHPTGLIILKHPPSFSSPEKVGSLERVDLRKYGKNALSFYTNKQ